MSTARLPDPWDVQMAFEKFGGTKRCILNSGPAGPGQGAGGLEPLLSGQEREMGNGSITVDEVRAAYEFHADTGVMGEVAAFSRQVAASNVPVLILGETGVGKGVLARRLHALSERANKPFVKLNCVAVPSELLESELFGYERGAFTGAFQSKGGRFEMAQGGTILLDEIGDMDIGLQGKLLHFLEDHEFYRLGGRQPVQIDVRMLAATHCDLEEAIRQRRFRADLYYRLSVVKMHLPPLRQRREEILPLAHCFLDKHALPGAQPNAFPPALEEILLAYDWPGNIRELENVVREFVVCRSADRLVGELRARMDREAHVPPGALNTPSAAAESAAGSSLLKRVSEAQKEAETRAIRETLAITRWNRKQAAALLGIEYKALLYKMKKLGIVAANERFGPEV